MTIPRGVADPVRGASFAFRLRGSRRYASARARVCHSSPPVRRRIKYHHQTLVCVCFKPPTVVLVLVLQLLRVLNEDQRQ